MKKVDPIFILSMPRSGSTLLQRVIASSAKVGTASEPWLLLPFLYALRDRGTVAEYDFRLFRTGFSTFLSGTPDGRSAYLAAVRRMASELYANAAGPGHAYFLDKTPRYSLVVRELFEVFPSAKYVFLFRNPLAVAASLVESFAGGRWSLHRWDLELHEGLANLVQASGEHARSSLVIRYEDLAADPLGAFAQVGEYLGIEIAEAVAGSLPEWQADAPLGDPLGVRAYSKVSSEPLEKWKTVFRNPLRKAWGRDYLDWIGTERLRAMGYDQAALLAELDAIPPASDRLASDVLSLGRRNLLRLIDSLPRSWH